MTAEWKEQEVDITIVNDSGETSSKAVKAWVWNGYAVHTSIWRSWHINLTQVKSGGVIASLNADHVYRDGSKADKTELQVFAEWLEYQLPGFSEMAIDEMYAAVESTQVRAIIRLVNNR